MATATGGCQAAKELHSIVDYAPFAGYDQFGRHRSPLRLHADHQRSRRSRLPCYWTGTTHGAAGGRAAVYIAFGRAMGYMGEWRDVHGAGTQRSDPKAGNPADFPQGRGPQGDAIRIDNYVRPVRNIDPQSCRLVEPDLTPLPVVRKCQGGRAARQVPAAPRAGSISSRVLRCSG